jgi:hypothetical protein
MGRFSRIKKIPLQLAKTLPGIAVELHLVDRHVIGR